jgi:peptidylprolyl isomerase
MLVLTRRIGEQIVIDGVIGVTVVAIQGEKVRLAISAPLSVRVDRSEVHQRRQSSLPKEGVPMRTVQQGDRVQVHYVKRLQDGTTASSREPFELTVGIDHPRLPGLGTELVGLTPGQSATVTVPPERAYGLPNPARIRRCSPARFPQQAPLRVGKLVRFTQAQGRRRLVRILEVSSKMVVVDANHPWAGQSLVLEVKLVAFVEAPNRSDTSVANPGGSAPSAG